MHSLYDILAQKATLWRQGWRCAQTLSLKMGEKSEMAPQILLKIHKAVTFRVSLSPVIYRKKSPLFGQKERGLL